MPKVKINVEDFQEEEIVAEIQGNIPIQPKYAIDATSMAILEDTTQQIDHIKKSRQVQTKIVILQHVQKLKMKIFHNIYFFLQKRESV